jgi:hypothetical protein
MYIDDVREHSFGVIILLNNNYAIERFLTLAICNIIRNFNSQLL